MQPPVPHEGWEGVHDATSFGHQCWQMSVVTRQLMGDEDCLFINVASRQVKLMLQSLFLTVTCN